MRAFATATESARPGKAGASRSTCLSFERGAATTGSSGGLLDVGPLIELARERGLTSNGVVRDALARVSPSTCA